MITYGLFINAVIDFLIVSFVIILGMWPANRLQSAKSEPAATPTASEYSYCLSTVPLKDTRCGYCAADLKTV